MPDFSSNTILAKRTSVAGRVPLLSSLSLGEFAVNTTDGLIFLKQHINNEDVLINFPHSKIIPYTLNQDLSSVNFQYGNNNVYQILATILGGVNNEISGAGSAIVTGESNLISADFAAILNGFNNRIVPTGNYSSILGGQNNLISHENSFTLGSNLSSHAANFTYVNNLSGNIWGIGSNLTNLNASNISSGTLPENRLPAFYGDVVTTIGSASATVAKMQGYPISTATPSIGQMLQWSGTAWMPGTVPTGGSGGGGVVYYLNYGTAGTSPTAGLSGSYYKLGRSSTLNLSAATFTNVSQVSWNTLATFVTDPLDPQVGTIAAGIWDLNFWASSTASTQTQMTVRYQAYTYNSALSTTTLIATSDTYNIYDPVVIAQYVLSMIVPQTTIDLNDRLFLVLQAQSASPNKDITVYFNNERPTHLHTTIPSVGGSGLVKVIDGIYQSPASLLVDVDVASNAQINQSKILNLTTDLNSKLNKSGGTLTGDLSGTNAIFSGAVYGSTATLGTSSTQLATTAFVQDSVDAGLASGTAIASTVVAVVTNADSVPLVRGDVVYSYRSQGDRVSVRKASASGEATSSKVLGFVNDSIAINGTGYVTLYGSMDRLDLGTPFVAGDPLWLGTTPGTYTRVKPVAPIHLVYLGVVQRANPGNGTAYIKIQNGYELDELHDVLITNLSARQVLQRNEDNTLWINKTPLFQDSEISSSSSWNSVYTNVQNTSANWSSVYSTVQSNSAVAWNYQGTDLKALSGNWQNTYTTVLGTSANWSSVYSTVQSNSATYVTLSATQTLTNKTVVDWMSLVRGYNTTPTLNTTLAGGEVYNYVFTSSPTNKTYYRYIATDGSDDAFYSSFNGSTLSGLVARKAITI